MHFCKICSRQLEKEGDICIDCYNSLIEEEENIKDDKIMYSFGAKFSLKYELMKSPFMFFIILTLIIFAIVQGFQTNILTGILSLLIYLGLFILYFYLMKLRIESRVIDLYEKKLIYTRRLHFKNFYEVKYRNLAEIQFEDLDKKNSVLLQSSWWLNRVAKKFNMVTIFFKVEKQQDELMGQNFFIGPVHNFKEEILPKIMEITGLVEKEEKTRSSIEELLNFNKSKDKNKNREEKDESKQDDKENIRRRQQDRENRHKRSQKNTRNKRNISRK